MNSAYSRKAALVFRWICIFVLAVAPGLHAADKVTVTIGKQTISAYRTADLEDAKKEAAAAHKPIAWVASSPTVLDGRGTISQTSGRGATLHAFLALHERTILVFEDAYAENHKVLPLVDTALHTPNPHYDPPTVLFLDPAATNVLAKITYEPNYVTRAHLFAKALNEVKEKLDSPP
jgi:hypothetical protein